MNLVPKNGSISDFFNMNKLRDKVREEVPKYIAESKKRREEDDKKIQDFMNKANEKRKLNMDKIREKIDRSPLTLPHSLIPFRGAKEGRNGFKFD